MKKTLLSLILLLSIFSLNAQNHIDYKRYDRYNQELVKKHNRPRFNILPIIGAAITGVIIANQINETDNYNNQRELMRNHYWQNQLELQRIELMQRQLEVLQYENRRPRGVFGIFNRRHNRY